MKASEKITRAVDSVAGRLPYDQITYADIAEEAGVHWTTVRRHFGNKENLKKVLLEKQSEQKLPFADTRSRILEAARTVFAKHGYHGASLDQVAEQAGLTKGAVYWHFSGKSDLYLSLCNESLSRFVSMLPKQMEEVFASGQPETVLKELLDAEFAACRQDEGERPKLFLEFVSSIRDPEIRRKLNDTFSRLFDGTTEIMRQYQQQNRISRTADPRALSVTVHALLNGIVLMWLIAPDRVSLDSMAGEVAHLLFHGLNPSKDENPVPG